MLKKNVIAVYGGAFNPPLNSHIQFAQTICDTFESVQKIVFVPVSSNYNKPNLLENKHRYNMLKLICDKNAQFDVSTVELDSPKVLYTIETLEILKKQYPFNEIWFIIGTDNLKELSTWKDAEKLINNYKIIVLKRENYNIDEIISEDPMLNSHVNSFIKLDVTNNLSSSYARDLIKNGMPFSEYMPEDVYDYIVKNGLYE